MSPEQRPGQEPGSKYMGSFVRWTARWNGYWFAERTGHAFGLFRIALALTGLVLATGSLRLVPRYYSATGEFPIEAARYWSTEWAFRWLLPEWSGSAVAAWTIMGVWIGLLLLLLVGRWMRWVPLLSWICALWVFARNPTYLDGGDEVFRLASLYLAFSCLLLNPRDQPLSRDRQLAIRRGEREPGPATMPAWPVRLIQIQIMIVYFVAGFWKIIGPPWWDGSALYYALAGSTFSRIGAAWAEGIPQLFFIVTTISIAWWEFLFPLLVSVGRLRRAALAFGVAIHLGILLTMNVGLFPYSMLACYPVFLTEGEAAGWVRRLPVLRRL